MRSALIFAVLALLAAGCLGGSTPPSTVKTASADATSAGPASAVSNMTNDTMVVMLPPVKIEYKGSSPQGACVYGTPADQCQFQSQGTENFHPVAYKGKAKSGAIKVTYGAVQPGMAFYAAICTGKTPDPVKVSCDDYKTGPSGFVIEKPLADVPEGAAIAISVGSLAITPTPAGALVFTAADFSIQGTLTVQ